MNEVCLHVLGCGDAFGSGGRLQTCFRLVGGTDDVLIDCGATSLSGMKHAGIDPSQIGYIALTHLHGDHFAGLPFLLLDGQFRRRERPLLVAGPPGVQARVEALMETLFPRSSTAHRRFAVEFQDFSDRVPMPVGPAVVTPFAVIHYSGAPSYALRIEYAGKTVAYSGDTEWTNVLLQVARDADLFVCEAYFFDKRVKYHLDYQALSAHLPELECRRVLLTHMTDDMLGRLTEIPVSQLRDGDVIVL